MANHGSDTIMMAIENIPEGLAIQSRYRHIRRSRVRAEKENVPDRSRQGNRTSKCQSNYRKNRSVPKRMYFSDDDSVCYETTASQDERIAQQLRQEREEERVLLNSVELERKEAFEEAFQENTHEIFRLPGLTFLRFTHIKIKFRFEPRKVVSLVNEEVKFYCSLRYHQKYGFWGVRRDSCPANYKARIYSIFYRGRYFSITDDQVADAIVCIYRLLKSWAKEEQAYRQEKFKRYKNGEDVILDSDDEKLFLTESERRELHAKRDRILKRMLPKPGMTELPLKRVRKKRK